MLVSFANSGQQSVCQKIRRLLGFPRLQPCACPRTRATSTTTLTEAVCRTRDAGGVLDAVSDQAMKVLASDVGVFQSVRLRPQSEAWRSVFMCVAHGDCGWPRGCRASPSFKTEESYINCSRSWVSSQALTLGVSTISWTRQSIRGADPTPFVECSWHSVGFRGSSQQGNCQTDAAHSARH